MISDYLTDKLDVLTTKLQRRGYRLTDINVYAVGCVFTLTVTGSLLRDSYTFAAINGGLWGYHLWERLQWAKKNEDYPESIKTMNRLNSEAIGWRDFARWFISFVCYVSIFFIMLTMALFVLKLELWLLVSALEWLSIVMVFLIRGCTFIGPGEFAKQQKEHALHNAVLDRSP